MKKLLNDLIEYQVVPVLRFEIVKKVSTRSGSRTKKFQEVVGTFDTAQTANNVTTCMVIQDQKHFREKHQDRPTDLTIQYTLCGPISHRPEPMRTARVPDIPKK